MSNTIESVLSRVTDITKDYDRVRWSDPELLRWANDGQDQIASLHMRAADRHMTLTLAGGARQDLRTIDPTVRWLRLQNIVCNFVGNDPIGPTVRQVSRPMLDAAFRTWRSRSQAAQIEEFAVSEQEPFTFDVFPPAIAGTRVLALVATKPTPITSTTGALSLADGFDIPLVDYILFRCFSKDANDPSYQARASGHLQAFQLAMGVETKDAKPE